MIKESSLLDIDQEIMILHGICSSGLIYDYSIMH
jgi:hypothetical protein